MSIPTYHRNFWLLCISSFLFFSSFTMVLAELPGFLDTLGGKEYLGLIISLFTLTAAISRPFSGKLSDLWGRIPVMIIGAVVSAISLVLYPFFATVAGLLLIRLIHGFSAGFTPTGQSAYVADIVPINRRGEALGLMSMFGTIGMAAGPPIGSAIFNLIGINNLFFISSACAFGSILILSGLSETLEVRNKFSFRLLRLSKHDLFERTALSPSIVMLLTTVAFGTVITLAPDFSVALGLTNKGIFFTVFTGASLLVRIIGGRLSDRYGRVKVLYASTLMLFLSLLIIGTATSQLQFFIGAVLFGFGYGLNSPTLFAWVIDLVPDQNRGKGISTLFISLEIGIGSGALIMGSMYQGINERFPYLFGAAAICSLLAFMFLMLKRHKNRRLAAKQLNLES